MNATLGTIAALCGVLGTAYGSVWFLDERYAPMAAFDDFVYSALKEDIRELKDRIDRAQNQDVKRGLELDLDSLLDRLCRSYPMDRECNQLESGR